MSNFINIVDIQKLENENTRVYGDFIQTLELEVYRVISNTKSLEFDPCAETIFETVLTELRKQNKQEKNDLILKFDTIEPLRKKFQEQDQ